MKEQSNEQKRMLEDAYDQIEALMFNNPPVPMAEGLLVQAILDKIEQKDLYDLYPLLELLNDMIVNELFCGWGRSQIDMMYEAMYLIGRAMPIEDQVTSGEIQIRVHTGPNTSFTTFAFLPDDIVNGWISDDNLADIRHIVQTDIDKRVKSYFRYNFRGVSLVNGMIEVYGDVIPSDF